MVGGDGSFEPGMIRYDTIQYMIYDIRYDCFDFNQSNLLDTMSLYVVGVCRMSYFFLSFFLYLVFLASREGVRRLFVALSSFGSLSSATATLALGAALGFGLP